MYARIVFVICGVLMPIVVGVCVAQGTHQLSDNLDASVLFGFAAWALSLAIVLVTWVSDQLKH